MFYSGMGYSPTDAPTVYSNPNDEQIFTHDGLPVEPVESEPEKETGDAHIESIYSCDSLLDEIDDAHYEDDDEPFDHRTKQYLDANCKNMKLLLADPYQQYAALKVAHVLSRGTLSAKKQKRKLEAIKKTLPCHKIVTSDYSEAQDLLKEINFHINKDENPNTKQEIFNKIITLVKNDMNENTVQRIKRSELPSLHFGEGNTNIVDVRQLAMDLVSSSSEEESEEAKEDESSGEEPVDFTELHKIDFLFPKKGEERLFTPSFKDLDADKPAAGPQSNLNRSPVHHPSSSHGMSKAPGSLLSYERAVDMEVGLLAEREGPDMDVERHFRGFSKLIGHRASSSGIHNKNRKCSRIVDPEALKISKKRMIIIYKELILKKLQYHVYTIQEDNDLMKHKLFSIWNARMLDGIEKMKKDIVRRKNRLNHRIQRMHKQNILNQTQARKVGKEKKEPTILPEIDVMKNKRWRTTVECMREREKLLIEKQGCHFFSGFLGDRAAIKTERIATKVWPEIPTALGVPPAPPLTNKKILKIISKFMESKQSKMTYGDLMRILEGDISLIMEGEFEEELDETKNSYEESNAEQAKRPSCREWNELIRKDNDIDSPFLTKRELKNYLKMLDEKFFTNPNFKLAEELVSVDENALITQEPDVLKLNYSLKELERDSYQADDSKCAQSRGIYFFQYKSEFTPIDIQAAYEQYVYENTGFEDKPHEHPSGCLLIYENVKLVIVMIEGQVDHLFYHFAGFKNSQLHEFIEIGRVLYVSDRVSCILSQWVSIVTEPPPGEITYLTNSKKVLHRVAEPRAHQFKKTLHDLYSFLSTKVKRSEYRDEENDALPSNMKTQLSPCQCQKSTPNEGKSESGATCDMKSQIDPSQLDLSVQELLPPPALVAYLLKYRKLRTIDRFLDEFVMQPVIESEDEKYDVIEDAVLSNYIDSDDEKDKPRLIKEIKRVCKEREIVTKCQQDLMDIVDKEKSGEEKGPWIQLYETSMFTPILKKVQVRKKGGATDRTIDVDPLIDSDEEPDKTEEEEQYILWNHHNEKLSAQRKFLNFLDTGAESWQKKVKRFGLTGGQIKKMLRDAQKYKRLRRILRLQDKMKTVEHEASDERDEAKDVVEIEHLGDGDKELDGESEVSLLPDTMEEIEGLLTEFEEEGYLGEEMDWPPFTGFERMGELPETFGERRFYRDFSKLEWDDELDQAHPQLSRVELQSENFQASSDLGESVTEYTSVIAGEEGTIPEAPPATSVTDTSTDP